MTGEIPNSARLNAADFIDSTIITELEKTGFIDHLYNEPSKK